MKKLAFLILPILMAVSPGDMAPDFTAKNQNGKTVQMKDFKGKYVLLYFYPKDDTPGCTMQAQGLRDIHKTLKELNTVVFGVSRQGEKSHQEFIKKYNLPFDLLVDEDGQLAKTFGVDQIPMIGLSKRQSILIGANGKVLKFYTDVDPAKHAEMILLDLQKDRR